MPEPGEAQPLKLTREQIDTLLYGGRYNPRFTQDSPVLPDVWIKYAEEPDRPHEVLLTPYQNSRGGTASAGDLSRVLKACLAHDQARHPPGRPRGPAAIAYTQATVLARLWFDELVRVVLPLSVWWHRLGDSPRSTGPGEETTPEMRARAQRERRTQLLRSLRTADGQAAVVKALLDPRLSSDALTPDIAWMVNVVGSIWLLSQRRRDQQTPWWPKDDDDVLKLSGEALGTYKTDLGEHYRHVVERVVDLTDGIEDAPFGVEPSERDRPMVWSVSLNRRAHATMWRSRATVKADAAVRVFEVSCRDLAWAVIDSGINARHVAFRARKSTGTRYDDPFEDGKNRTRVLASYDFSVVRDLLSEDTLEATAARLPAAKDDAVKMLLERVRAGLDVDWELVGRIVQIPHVTGVYREPTQEHGTHVAGILAGDCRQDSQLEAPTENTPVGLCHDLQLYDLRVLNERGEGDEFNVMAALQFVRHMNARSEAMVVHGVNLSLSIRHDIANFGCGRTPVCEECERLVGGGIVVVTAAGNDGYLQYLTPRGPQDSYRSISITDPGNAAGVITVGSTHRFQPHTYGVSYFSSRGPTGDGRAKPDLVAPGEKIEAPVGGGMDVKRMDGTSMAAPHVSGAAALLIARHRELAGQPARVKDVLCTTATDLGRERYFQGAGLVDVLRALQSV